MADWSEGLAIDWIASLPVREGRSVWVQFTSQQTAILEGKELSQNHLSGYLLKAGFSLAILR